MSKNKQNPKWSILIIVLIMTIFLGLVGILVLQIFQSIYIQSSIVHDYYKAYYISNAGIEISLVKHKVRWYNQRFEDTDKYETTIKNVTYDTKIKVDNLKNKICKTIWWGKSTDIYMYYYASDQGWIASINKPSENYIDVENSIIFDNIQWSFEYTIWSYDKSTKELIDNPSWNDGNSDWLFAKPLPTTPINIWWVWIHKISIANVSSSQWTFCINGSSIPSDELNITSEWKFKNTTIILKAKKIMNSL